MMMDLALAHALLPQAVCTGAPDTAIERVHSDTRSLRAGDLFVALRGERFDAHGFLPQARSFGAVAALVSDGEALHASGLPGLVVPDTRTALQTLAAGWRRRMHLPLIAVAGSNGKTTATQMTASVLRAWLAGGAFATEGNFNNDIGVPLTLLRLRQDASTWHAAGVVELGMNHPGEIAQLARIAAPSVALVTNAQREHQEFMHSVEAVARENGAAIEALGPTGTAVFPADDAHAPVWHALAGHRPVLTFAFDAATDASPGRAPGRSQAGPDPLGGSSGVPDGRGADIRAEALWIADHWALTLHTPAGTVTATLRMAGKHNVRNALAATACALAAGCPLEAVARGLAAFEPVKGRSQTRALHWRGRQVTLVDDSYNANPDSVRAAIDLLADLPGPRWLVLGDMGEVGAHGPAFHAEVGAYARERGIDALWTAGAASRASAAAYGAGARSFDDATALAAALDAAPDAASIVVKGSRFMQTERVVAALAAAAGSTPTEGAADAH